MPDAWTSFDESLRSRAGLRNQHEDCPHLSSLGGGINLRRLRPEFGAGMNPDFGARWEESRNRCRAGKEAFKAAKARAAGKNREEIRQLYIAGLQARDLQVPDDPILDTAIDSITGNPFPAARLLGHQLATMGKEIHELTKLSTEGH